MCNNVYMSRPNITPSGVHLRPVDQSDRLKNVFYEIRGPIQDLASSMEAEGHKILKLNIGNPAPFGFEAPDAIVRDMLRALPYAQGYTDSKGILSARRAVVTRYEDIPNFPYFDVDDVFLGNGVSELINIVMMALLNPEDEILIPAPDYPLWTAMTNLAGGKAVHYLCDENNDWNPDIEDIRSKITPRTKGIVVINPNNPTGAVYSPQILQQIVSLAREHQLIIFADEIYDRILYDGAVHHHIAAMAQDLLCLTFCGLSKTYRVAGYRSGWLVITGPKKHARQFIQGIELLASARLCPNAPAQHGIQVALGGYQSIEELLLPQGRLLEQRNVTHEILNSIPGVSCYKPQGALYAFPKIDTDYYQIYDDSKLVEDFLRQEKVHIVQGTGFNWPHPDHVRIVTLPWANDLRKALQRFGNFLSSYSQTPP